MSTARQADVAAISLSGLCILHCLALPVIAASLPVLGVVAENELVHKVLVVLTIPISLFAWFRSTGFKGKVVFGALMLGGIGLLAAGAFVEALHDYETPLTVAGALVLAGAHAFRWISHKR